MGFEIVCNQNIPYLTGTDLRLLEIFPGEVQFDSSPFIFTGCSIGKGDAVKNISLPSDGPYTFSTKNRYTVVRCNVLGAIVSEDLIHPWGGSICSSFCHTRENMDSGYCTGKGCCQTILPDMPKALGFSTFSFSRPNITLCGPCGYGFVVEEGSYDFTVSDVWELNRTRNFTLRLDWSIGEEYCSTTLQNNYTSRNNSHCEQPTNDGGYLCKCFSGYEGNPYLNGSQGCQYINNCTRMENSPCVPEATCDKTDSDVANKDYICVCPAGTLGDGFKVGDGCKARSHANHPLYRASMFAVAVISCLALLYSVQIKRHLAQLSSKHFQQNGGLLLQQYDSTRKGTVTSTKHVKVFSVQELEKATDNYHRSRDLDF
ncbi:Wall-associated receptor kinase [Thalictrum thalictroides]|uniref:Wall-associated receptor kinase n=1 Tax=Thalictrum thalictroides TaxID=46969 RepID=A0A7J6WAD4_THATH|nr:Wall-associated receptor kinase [Thalictrum thalictroides]